MKIIISNIIKIEDPTDKIKDYCKEKLTLKNPDYSKKVQMGFWTGGTSKHIRLYDYDDKNIYLPIGCFNDLYDLYPDSSLYSDFSVSKPRNILSSINLRNYQKPCLNALKTYVNGLFVLPCGLGKTECALQTIYHLQQKALFITHTKDLLNQAKDRCEEKMTCTTSVISDGKVDTSGDITFATVQTLFQKLDGIPQDEFGLIVVDECHHLSTNADSVCMFRECIDHFAARYKLGLTATLHRADGLQYCIPKLLGDVIYEVMQDGDDYIGVYEGKEILRFPINEFQVPAAINVIETNYRLYDNVNNCYRDVFEKNGMTLSFSKLISDIGNDKERNKLIIDLCKKLDGSTIILSDRVEQLKYLNKYINDSVEIDGSTKKNIREQAIEDIKNGKKKVLLASYKLAKEGLDCKILENIILATPIKDEAIVIQCIGRVQRTYPGKTVARVFDLLDDVSMLSKFFTKRRAIYKKKGWWKE